MIPQDFTTIITKIADLSVFINKVKQNDNALFDYLDQLDITFKQHLLSKYQDGNGPILNLRRSLAKQLNAGPINRADIVNQFDTGKQTARPAFALYQDLFSIFYPFALVEENHFAFDLLTELAELLSNNLGIKEKTKIKIVGFDGARNTGTDRVWMAIYNKTHPNQKTAKQLFLSIQSGNITYALYDRKNDQFIERNDVTADKLSYENLVSFYKNHINAILNDVYGGGLSVKDPLNAMLDGLASGKVSAWLVKPGEGAFMWNNAIKEGNYRIGWGYVINEMYDQNNFSDDFILQKLNEHYPSDTTDWQNNNKGSILNFCQKMKVDDIVFAISGQSSVIGVGIITSDIIFDEDEEEYTTTRKVDWLLNLKDNPFIPGDNFVQKTVTPFPAERASQLLVRIFNNNHEKNTIRMELPFVNTILYGPPGTGKTYTLNQYKEQLFTDKGIALSKETILRTKTADYCLWQVLAAALQNAGKPLSVSELAKDPLVVSKMNPANKVKPNNVIWSVIQSYADDVSTQMDSSARRPLQLFHKNEESKWSIAEDKVATLHDLIGSELLNLTATVEKNTSLPVSIRERYNFITFHQKYSYEDFIEGIKPVLRTETDTKGDLQFELKKGIFYKSCLEALTLADYSSFEQCYESSREERRARFAATTTKSFALFIDEINRANISAVFGELITLLEKDKRCGEDNEIWIQLPYSNERFCVPPNLYIIGTMNTADRSIALLDIALRRRFEFISRYPEYQENQWWSTLLIELNKAIYSVKPNPDFFIGHAFFMKREETDKAAIFNTKIIPLLMEYFHNNINSVKDILIKTGVPFKQMDIARNYQIIAE